MEVRRDPRQFLFFIILIILINSPESHNPGFNPRSRYDEVIEREWEQLDILNRTRWGDFDTKENKWLNITGLRKQDAFTWDVLGNVKSRARERMRGVLGERTQGWLDGKHEDERKETVYRNISGFVQGEWVLSPLSRTRPALDLLNATGHIHEFAQLGDFDRNLTGTHGMVRLHLTEVDGRQRTDENRTMSELKAKVVIGDAESWGDNWWEFNLNGVHFPEFGGAVLTTTSERFSGIFALPHLQLSPHLYLSSQELLNRTIHQTIQNQLDRPFPVWNPWSSTVEDAAEGIMATTHCELILFLQEAPVQLLDRHGQPANQPDLEWLEQEIRFPTGANVPLHSQMSMDMVGFSPDCGFVIESKGPPDFPPSEAMHLVGLKTEEFNDDAKRSILAFAVTLAFQLMFIIRQAKEAATPSTRNRISFYTIAIMALGDGFMFLALVFLHLFLGTSQLQLFTIAFLALFSVVLELRFLMDIWTVQATEQMRQDRQQASATPPSPQPPSTPSPSPQPPSTPSPTPAPPRAPPPSQNDAPPLATATATQPQPTPTPPPPPPPVIITPDQDDPADNEPLLPTTNPPAAATPTEISPRAELGALYSRYCFLLIVTFFITLQFTTMRSTARAFYFNTLSFLYLSFWLPQIYRNIMRNCRKALRWDFVLGQSAVRLVPIAYFYAVESNVLFSRTDLQGLAVLVGWVWCQIVVLAAQEVLGSRFFVREGWAPPAYDYHPVLREDEEGATMPIGSSSPSPISASGESESALHPGESRAKGKKLFDCSICATDLEVPVIPAGGGGPDVQGLGALTLQRRAYMVTPCRHIFHSACLEGWMRYRLQCPNCREVLPPL
ncbi:hypothetical protein PMIN03_005291 [Paraphaeosphaeria minitans]|uniref:DSC E3 ubiquitin ligase complex subunit A n=1 Tax=Paraphaeosphaeria minitans TaxID=565426 RepID=A0A9P6GRJ9_9PLEO|nr:hypothetical protein PMIN01_01568 [Paraphaeosphaeria minitans]